jgi:uncharacterized protein
MTILHAVAHALAMAFAMFWEILWALILGFFISGMVQAVVSKREMSRLLPDDSFPSILKALGLGAASSSCSIASGSYGCVQSSFDPLFLGCRSSRR